MHDAYDNWLIPLLVPHNTLRDEESNLFERLNMHHRYGQNRCNSMQRILLLLSQFSIISDTHTHTRFDDHHTDTKQSISDINIPVYNLESNITSNPCGTHSCDRTIIV